MKKINRIIGILTITLMLTASAYAQRGLGNASGMARGYLQPEIVSIEGTLDHIKTGPCEQATGYAYIGTHLFLQSENSDELLNVHLGAAFAVEPYVDDLKPGDKILVRAFQTDEMSPTEFVAKEVTSNSRMIELRDNNLRPFWAGERNFSGRWHHRHHRGGGKW